jgi:hypothetical protein
MKLELVSAELQSCSKKISVELMLYIGGREIELSLNAIYYIEYGRNYVDWESVYTDDDEALDIDEVQQAIQEFLDDYINTHFA